MAVKLLQGSLARGWRQAVGQVTAGRPQHDKPSPTALLRMISQPNLFPLKGFLLGLLGTS